MNTKTQIIDEPKSQKSEEHHHSHEHEHGNGCCAHHTKIGRNDPCTCGSGKKYKKCCLGMQTK